MISVSTHLLPALPDASRRLIWDEFFDSRARGISLAAHSPWIDASTGLFCIIAAGANGDDISGTLVVKCHSDGAEGFLGLIGYVCVDPSLRGMGIGRAMVHHAIQAGRDQGMGALILWTQSPRVYLGSGFVRSANDIFRQYAPIKTAQMIDYLSSEEWPGPDEPMRGIPAFARSGRRLRYRDASVIVLDAPGGTAVAEWTGRTCDVADLIGAAMKENWWLNALAGDALLEELKRRRVPVLQERPSSMMIRCLDERQPELVVGVRILDRV